MANDVRTHHLKEGAVLGLPPILLLSAQSRRGQILAGKTTYRKKAKSPEHRRGQLPTRNPQSFAVSVSRQACTCTKAIPRLISGQLLGLGDSPSAQVEASRYLKKWSLLDGFLEKAGRGGNVYYTLRKAS